MNIAERPGQDVNLRLLEQTLRFMTNNSAFVDFQTVVRYENPTRNTVHQSSETSGIGGEKTEYSPQDKQRTSGLSFQFGNF